MMDQLALYTVQSISNLLFDTIPLNIGDYPAYNNDQLTPNSAYVIREDNATPNTLVNIFDLLTGVKCYTISRSSSLSVQWYMYAEPEHVEVARVSIGGFVRRIDVLNSGSTLMKVGPGILGKFHRHFYDQQGNMYSWNRRSKYLERLTNPGGGLEERRVRVASVDHLRARRFDWEVRIDKAEVDPIVTLATAFVTMKTQWSVYGKVTMPTGIPSGVSGGVPGGVPDDHSVFRACDRTTSTTELVANFTGNNIEQLQAYHENPKTNIPRDFFNPPEFMQDKYLHRSL